MVSVIVCLRFPGLQSDSEFTVDDDLHRPPKFLPSLCEAYRTPFVRSNVCSVAGVLRRQADVPRPGFVYELQGLNPPPTPDPRELEA